MVTRAGNWYIVPAVRGVPLEQQAKDHGELNDHIVQVQDLEGNLLWERAPETIH